MTAKKNLKKEKQQLGSSSVTGTRRHVSVELTVKLTKRIGRRTNLACGQLPRPPPPGPSPEIAAHLVAPVRRKYHEMVQRVAVGARVSG